MAEVKENEGNGTDSKARKQICVTFSDDFYDEFIRQHKESGLKQAAFIEKLLNEHKTKALKAICPEDMKEAINDLENKAEYLIQAMATTLTSASERNSQLISSRQAEIERVRAENNALEDKLKQYKASLEQYNQAVKELADAKKNVEELTKEIERLKTRNDELSKVNSDNAIKLKNYDSLQQTINDQQIEKATLTTKLEDLNERLQEQKDLNKSQQANFDKMLAQISQRTGA